VDQAVKETLTFKTDHVYSYQEMGFTRQQIVEIYADIFERFGFDKRELEASEVEPQTVTVSVVD
jgi:DNA/RNA-binding domain of Phe-tRNA-synthetase-like protein